MKEYRRTEWRSFRKEVIELDGGVCTECNRAEADGAILQVHHKEYISGKLPWEYPYDMCKTLCKGCHAAEHGKIPPKSGWEYGGSYDLEDICGSCELCGSSIRYVYYVFHEKWPALEVGTVCCDNLTDTKTASTHRRMEGRKIKFIHSPRWKEKDGDIRIKQKGVNISLSEFDSGYQVMMNQVQGEEVYNTLEQAKERVFDFIDSGEADEFFKNRQ